MHELLRAGFIQFLVLPIVYFLLFGSYFLVLTSYFLLVYFLLFTFYFLLFTFYFQFCLTCYQKTVTTTRPSRVKYLRTLEAHWWPVV